jgi:CRP-like cAMP-binding protein
MSELHEALAQLAVFERLEVEEIEVLAKGAGERTFNPGEVLWSEGDPPGGLFVVLDGAVELIGSFAGGVERVFGTVRSGQVLGLLSVIDNGPRPATARAVEPTRVLAMDLAVIADLRDSVPITWAKIISGLGDQLAAQMRLIVEQYRRNIAWSLEVSGCAGLNLNRLLTDSVAVEVELINGSLVSGVIMGIESDETGHHLLLRSDDGRLRLIPYRSVVQIMAARADFEPALVE